MLKVKKVGALVMAGLTLFGSLMVTSTFAAPPKNKKPPKTKPGKKPAKPSGKALIEAGKKVYTANGCSACHAIAGNGGTSGPELTKIAADAKHDAKFFKESVVNPKADSPDSTMPSYEETIKGKDLNSLVAYLQSLK